MHPEKEFYRINMKAEPEQAYFYRSVYPGIVVRGYHCPPVQQPYWNTIDINAFEDMDMLLQMIDEAYEAVVHMLKKKKKAQLLELAQFEFRDTDGEDTDFERIYVKPAYRGIGLGKEIVRRLEAKAKIHGFQWCILETGAPLEASLHMYKKLGYKEIAGYGPYANMRDSICMQKKL